MKISRELEELIHMWLDSHKRADWICLTARSGLPVSAKYTHDHARGGERTFPAVFEFKDWAALGDSTLREEYLALLEEETDE